MKLNILLSTIDERIDNVPSVLLEPMADVSYVVVHQCTTVNGLDVPSDLSRRDVTVSCLFSSGVAKSRNRALELADGDIGLFSDDDVRYSPADFEAVLQAMSDYPEVDVAKFKIRTPAGDPEYRVWPSESYNLTQAESTGTIQIAVRLSAIRRVAVEFDGRFGAGNWLLIGGDEQIFLADCIAAGLTVRYFPIYVVEHPYVSTAKQIGRFDARKARMEGGIDARLNGWIAIPKALAGTFRYFSDIRKHRRSPIVYFCNRLFAAIYIVCTNQPKLQSRSRV